MALSLLIMNAVVTWFMTGLIWFVQIVHYPLFDSVGSLEFQSYAVRHRHLTTMVVALPMITEITTALLLVILWKRSDAMLLWVCFALVMAIWICTAFGSVACHEKLCTSGFSATTHRWLLTSNWLRTILWTMRSLILAYIIYKQVAKPLNASDIQGLF